MRAFGAAQVLLGFCLGRWPPRGGWVFLFCFVVIYMQALCKRISPFGPAFKELVCSWELVVTNYLCRMMGKLERDGFCEADQILHKLLPYWRHTYHIRNSHSNCQVWALSVLSLETHRGRLLLVYLGPQTHWSVCLVWEDQLARMLALCLGILDTWQDFSLNSSTEWGDLSSGFWLVPFGTYCVL